MRVPLQELLGGIARLLNGWSAQRERPLISGGEGWLCLLDYMNWDAVLFDRWLAAAPLHERIARFDYLGQPPQARDRLAGWQALLAGLVADRGQLRPADWLRIAPRLERWNETDQVELRSTLRKRTLDRLRSERAATAELHEWIAAWRAGGAPGRAIDLFEDLRLRTLRTRDPGDAALAISCWRDSDRPADWVPDLAGALQAVPDCSADLVAELAAALPVNDERCRAAGAVLDCCAAAGGRIAAALAPLAQRDPAPGAWRFDAAWSESIASSFANWMAALDRTQQHEEWKKLLAHRTTLAAAGILQDS